MNTNRAHLSTMAALVLALIGGVAAATENPLANPHTAPNANPYAGQQRRAIKALSSQEIADLETGRGMGLSKVAELNHYPGPKHALELADGLQLSDSQTQQIRKLLASMQQQAQEIGKQIVSNEAELDKLFTARHADENTVHQLLADIGRLQADLRFVHVNAHIATAHVLSAEQIAAYDRLRGYTSGEAATHAHHH